MTAGMKTTEFWLSLAVALTGLLVALGVIGPDEAEIANEWVAGVVQAAGVLVMAISSGMYASSRGTAKSAG